MLKMKFAAVGLFVAFLSAPVLADPPGKTCALFTPETGFGYETIETGYLYVVHSAAYDTVNNRIPEVSNIFIIKGNTDRASNKTTIWLYGSGYGNDDDDLKTYQNLRGNAGWTPDVALWMMPPTSTA
jgi:hypothetical protein